MIDVTGEIAWFIYHPVPYFHILISVSKLSIISKSLYNDLNLLKKSKAY
jgi:hypothetical protein